MKLVKGPVVLVIRDGWGEGANSKSNSVTCANKPTTEMLAKKYPQILIHGDGEYVGLPKGQMGNSEVGHLNLGAGRIVYQSLTLINKSFKDKSIEKNKVLNETIKYVKTKNKSFHIMGLLSDGGVHSHIEHMVNTHKYLTSKGIKNVYFHIFGDGRDVNPKSIKTYLKIADKNKIKISSVSGRFFAMDRDQNWERTSLAYDAMVTHESPSYTDLNKYIDSEYKAGRTDEHLTPAFNSKINAPVKDGDVMLFANFRPDRARQISHMFKTTKIPGYKFKPKKPVNVKYITMMKYDGVDCPVLFEQQKLKNLFGDVVEKAGMKQIRAAETEKYAHVTFFFDGGVDLKRKNEIRLLSASPKVKTYDLKPEMSAAEVTANILKNIKKVDTAIINYANPDMVGHTGNIKACSVAVETVDEQIGILYKEVVEKLKGVMIVTSDHGNAEKMRDEKGELFTAHTTNLVTLTVTSNDFKYKTKFTKKNEGKLADIAPTMLYLLGLKAPKEMDGEVLIEKK